MGRKIARAALITILALLSALPLTQAVPQATGEETVYVTKTGKKYHVGDCPTLKKTKIPMKLKNSVKAGYEPCKVCHPPTLPKDSR